jgi:uncharacterized protein YjiS (DUF1127 family)
MYRSSTTATQLPPLRRAGWLLAHLRSARYALAERRTARDIGKLSPHQLRDIGLPEALSELNPRSLLDWLREETR